MKKTLLNAAAATVAMQVNAYRTRVMELNGVTPDIDGMFNVTPAVEQKLEDKVRENADFLKKINVVGVRDLKGEKVGIDVTGPIASRTNTDNNDRQTKSYLELSEREYECKKTEFDTHIKWNTLDSWSAFPDFQKRITNAVTRQIARDRLMIGFNGETAAAETDKTTNPLLQDVNIGWLKHIETARPEAFLDAVKIGDHAEADFANLDAALYAARHELLAPWHRNDTDLVAITGSGMIVDKNIAAISSHEAPKDRLALQTLIANQLIGTLPTAFVPFFPSKSVLITTYDNLSIYYQRGSRRRHIKDNPKRDRLEDFQTVNEAYVVEDFDKCAVISGVLSRNAENTAWE